MRKFKRSAFLLIFYSSCFLGPAFADMKDELDYLEQIHSTIKDNTQSELPPVPLAPIREKVEYDLKVYQAALKKGSMVFTLDEEKKGLKTPRPLFVQARLEYPGSSFALLLDKNEEPRFRTRTANLESLDRVTNLYPDTDPTQSYEDLTIFRSKNVNYQIENKLSFHIESGDASYLARYHFNDESSSSSTRFQAETYFLSFLPFDLGLSLSFQAGSFGSDEGENRRVTFQGAHIGPVVKAKVYEKDKGSLDIFVKAETSLGISTNDGVRKNEFSSNAWSLGADYSYQTFLGRFFAGINYRVQRFSLKESNIPNLSINPEKESLNGPGLYLGYRFDVNL